VKTQWFSPIASAEECNIRGDWQFGPSTCEACGTHQVRGVASSTLGAFSCGWCACCLAAGYEAAWAVEALPEVVGWDLAEYARWQYVTLVEEGRYLEGHPETTVAGNGQRS